MEPPMSSLSHPTKDDIELALQEYGALSRDELLREVFPRTEDIFLAGGFSGEKPWDSVARWYRETVVPTCKRAGDKGMHILQVLNDPKSAADLTLVKLVSDFLVDYTSVAEATEIKLAIGIALLAMYCARIDKGEALGPPS